MSKIIISLFVFLIVCIVGLASYLGIFKTIIFQETEVGPFKLVYEEYVGDYKNTPIIQDRIYKSLLDEFKIETTKGFGIYYNDPATTHKDKLFSEIGCILEEKDYGKISEIEAKFKVKDYPKQKAVVTEFAFKNKLSVMIGIFKVYPALAKYITDKGISPSEIMEIYDVPNKKIVYIKRM